MSDSPEHVDDYDQHDNYLSRNTRSGRSGNVVITEQDDTEPEFDWAKYEKTQQTKREKTQRAKREKKQQAKKDGSLSTRSSTDEDDDKTAPRKNSLSEVVVEPAFDADYEKQAKKDRVLSARSSTDEGDNKVAPQKYSLTELVATLGSGTNETELPPELERRVRDFRLAQQKRRETHGEQKRWGIFGMYAHLAGVRVDLEWSEDSAWRRSNGQPYLSWKDFDEARQKGINNRPIFTYALIFVCSVMMVVEIGLNGWKFAPLDVNPMIGPSAEALIRAGARDTTLIVEEGQWFRIFSPLILHAGLIHWLVNMLALWFIGAAVEQSHGVVNAVVLFTIPGVGGNILSAIFLPQYISVGASGGIFGLIGACLADISLNWNLIFIKTDENDTETWRRNMTAIFWLALDIILNIVFGLTPFVDNFTHLGGLLYGLCCGLSTIEPIAVGFFGVHASTFSKCRSICIRFFGLIISVVFIMVTTVWLATSDAGETPCEGCRYLSCVPFPFWREEKWWYCDDCDFVVANLFKSTDGDNFFDRIDLTCPSNVIETIDISDEFRSDRDGVIQALPSYCRTYCEDVFV
jgi:membrane associated rhomboid family serine protease